MNLLCFVIWLCFYPVCSAIGKYAIALMYNVNGWKYFQSQKSSSIGSQVNFAFYLLIAVFLFFNL